MPRKSTGLTDRDKQLLAGVVAAKTYGEIAAALGLSFETVKSYMARLRTKLGVQTKVELALWAAKNRRHLACGP